MMIMTNEMLFLGIQLVVIVVFYILGKYVAPKLSQNDLVTLQLIQNWVLQFVNEASTFTNMSNAEKKEYVSEQVPKILAEKGMTMTSEQISALIETAYSTFIKTKEEQVTMQLMKENFILQQTSIIKK
jgi:hypothetical protein